MRTSRIIYNVQDYETVSDATVAIQAAIDDADASGGGIVMIPAGRYLLRSPGIVLRNRIILSGVGHGGYAKDGGTWFLIDQPDFVPITMQAHSQLERVGFEHTHNPVGNGWVPNVYPFTIQINGDDCVIRDVFLLNCYDGIAIGGIGNNQGRVFIDRVHGQPFHQGIVIYQSQDVARISNVHFWPYWNPISDDVKNWTINNGTGFVSYRNDNPNYINCFAFNYDTGFRFEKNTDGVTSKFHMVNCEADICRIGIKIVSDGSPQFGNLDTGSNHTGQLTNWSSQGENLEGSIGIQITQGSGYNSLFCSNVRLNLLHLNGVRVDGEHNFLTFDGIWIDGWNKQGNGWPALEAIKSSSRIIVGTTRRFSNGGNAAQSGGASDAVIL